MNRKENLITAFVLVLIISAQIIYATLAFNEKQSFHTDEMWSYGLSNSFYRPFLFLDPQISLMHKTDEDFQNNGQWLDGDFFKDYLTVSENERFRYDSVWYNQMKDMHPPLYYSVLHTVCSFFPGQFSWYFALSLNIIFLCITQVFLFLLAHELTKRRTVSLLICFTYACSISALFTFTFIRQYSMLTMWCTVLTYLAARLFGSDFDFKKYLAPIIAILFLSAMTQQIILVYMGALTFFMCVYLLIKKRFKTMLIFGLSMVVTVGVYIVVWPYALNAAAQYDISHIFSYWVEVRIYINRILRNTFGIKAIIPPNVQRMPIIVLLLMVLVPVGGLCFVFRHDAWFKRLWRRIKAVLVKAVGKIRRMNPFAAMTVGACFVYILVATRVSSAVLMGNVSIRYVSLLIPSLVAVALYIVHAACRFVLNNRKYAQTLFLLVVITSCICTNIFGDRAMVYSSVELSNEQIRQMLSDRRVVASLSRHSMIQAFPELLMDADKVYFDKFDGILAGGEYLEELRDEESFYVIVNASEIIWEKDMSSFMEEFVFTPQNADKQKLNDVGVQFIDDYIKLLEDTGFVQDIRIVGSTKNNEYLTIIIEAVTNK